MFQNFKKKFFLYGKFFQNFSEFFDDFLKICFSWIAYFTSNFLKNNFGQYSTPENSTCKKKLQKKYYGKNFKHFFENTFLK